MARAKICLLTAHAPSIGGGSAILHSLAAGLQNTFDIRWHYLAMRPDEDGEGAWLGQPIIGVGNPALDMLRTGMIFAGWQSRKWRDLLEKVLAVDCDAYWIVSHNEGLCLARDLARLTRRPIHLTVHDDWAGALCVRSRRHRRLMVLAASASDKALKAVHSFDVVSKGMRDYYRRRVGVEAPVVHRFIAQRHPPGLQPEAPCIRAGHLGSIYSMDDFMVFLDALNKFGQEQSRGIEVIVWGKFRPEQIPANLPDFVEIRPTIEESSVVSDLQHCHFVYAAYPFAKKYNCFRQTSMPTKLSTYVMAGRPILGHTPEDSTLASFIHQTGVGVVWPNLNRLHGAQAIARILSSTVPEGSWRQAGATYFGEDNVETMRTILHRACSVSAQSTGGAPS